MQELQRLQTKHASAPQAALAEALGRESADLIPWIGVTANFNWLGSNMPVSSKGEFQSFEVVDVLLSRETFGFFLMGGLLATQSGVKLFIKVHGATFGTESLREKTAELVRLTSWLVDEQNWETKAASVVF